MQLQGQKKRKNRESEKTNSVHKETKKIDRSADRHATDLIFGDTLFGDYLSPKAISIVCRKVLLSHYSGLCIIT
jgi:hypothetical protein